jgi:16S rRNA (uracil1498-N3)-methyltransferase
VPPRFYVPDLDPRAERVELPEDEAEHLARVLRLGAGAEIEIFDGRGGLWCAEVVQAGKRRVIVRPGPRARAAAESRVATTLVMSVLKSDKMDYVVRDVVMLGVAEIQPLVTARSETGMAALSRGNRIARWQRIAVSSAKQCGRAVVPPVHEAQTLDAFLSRPMNGPRLMFVEPSVSIEPSVSMEGGGVSPRRTDLVHDVPSPNAADLIIGPEGGWTVHEVAFAVDAGVKLVSLGARTLRADAVPLVALTFLLTVWGELK